jgi:hypothetical protein
MVHPDRKISIINRAALKVRAEASTCEGRRRAPLALPKRRFATTRDYPVEPELGHSRRDDHRPVGSVAISLLLAGSAISIVAVLAYSAKKP